MVEAAEKKEELVTLVIDPRRYEGGFTTNGKRMVGTVKVSQIEAEDLIRRMEEYDEIRDLHDSNSVGIKRVRMRNHEEIAKLYLADPNENMMSKKWSDECGLLDPWQWKTALTEAAREELRAERKRMWGI